ncbi:ferredoxin-type protein NapF [Vibrio aestuarianus]|uniref:ferredoxin-type protein NapF n=1 Tax=Vibrio aestuarianus TaxID=28171 RepID=UPI001558849E|nr:ferredoxin-type protein NapF [Vibrio aestuarianus]NGZ15356.1 ferredoxin-type protein NapF [Vibrio aestuarianus]NKZ51504.1 ferredoxin-type protein NapF [Vibrio aestuarianus]
MVDLSKRRFFARHLVDDNIVRLPWIAKPNAFTDDCTRCGRCLAACETQIITHGDGGFPTLDFRIDECTFCYQCADACPEPIFKPRTETPWLAKAAISRACLAEQNVECRTCSEACELMAISFKLHIGKVAQPVINIDDCNGCGACVSLCPTSAISVNHINNNER